MLRMYWLPRWFGLADEALEDALYDRQAFRELFGLRSGPLARARRHHLLKFRGLLLRRGTVVDATVVNAPSSTKNKDHVRDPETRRVRFWCPPPPSAGKLRSTGARLS